MFDDIGLGLMDDFNKFNVIDALNEYSYSNGVFITSCKNDVKSLVKKRVYNPNIIDL